MFKIPSNYKKQPWLKKKQTNEQKPPSNPTNTDLNNLRVCVCLQCHEACIAIYSSMENQKLSHWVVISVLSMFFCLLVYTLTGEFTPKHLSASGGWLPESCSSQPLSSSPGVYGFMTFGRAVASDILMSYPGNDVVMIISRLLFGISIITIYPIILLLGR